MQSVVYGSYAPRIATVTWRVRCQGGAADASDSWSSRKPRGPLVRIELGRFYGKWLDPAAHTRWEIRMTWRAPKAVECKLRDSVTRDREGLDVTPSSGADDRGYGKFRATVESVRLRITCHNVAREQTEEAVTVARPRT